MGLYQRMTITLRCATPDSLEEVADVVAAWQHQGGPVQLHPGDIGWQYRLGAQEVSDSVRVWRRDGQILAVGMVDGQTVIRMAIAPDVDEDDAFAEHLVADLANPASGVLPAGPGTVEARSGAALRGLLRRNGWQPDEPWTPLSRGLTTPVPDSRLRVEVITTNDVRDPVVRDCVAVHLASFARSTFTVQQWHVMTLAPAYRRARCLVGYDPKGRAVAAVTVWSAGQGRPGLLEPLGVHQDHRGHGYGTAISVAAAAALQEMGSSSATVCTPSSNVGAVATYVSAGFRQLADVTDFRRPG